MKKNYAILERHTVNLPHFEIKTITCDFINVNVFLSLVNEIPAPKTGVTSAHYTTHIK